jgi:hypothetical protein
VIEIFWRNFWRRGAHVNTLKIGSRGVKNCLGEILGVYADLRRDFKWGNLKLEFFGVLVEVPRETIEEGGQLWFLVCVLGEFKCYAPLLFAWGDLRGDYLRYNVGGEGLVRGELRTSVTGEG